MQAPLRIGCVKYLNARPLIRGWAGDICLESPSVLCRKLAVGELDVALVSSFEFLRNPVYRIVDGVSISSDGPVYSVVVAHQKTVSEIEEVELDPASETSVNLLRCLLAERQLRPRFFQRSATPDAGKARLLIGDQAIRFRRDHPDFQFWDLGEEWSKNTGLPFVYALWLIRPEISAPEVIAKQLRARCHENLNDLETLIATESDFSPEFCRTYYRDYLRFGFGDKEKQSLKRFQELCVTHKLLPDRRIELTVV